MRPICHCLPVSELAGGAYTRAPPSNESGMQSDRLPKDATVRIRVLMVILRRKRVIFGSSNFVPASRAFVNASKRSRCSRFEDLSKDGAIAV
jgi:hypothetical protein